LKGIIMEKNTNRRTALKTLGCSTAIVGSMAMSVSPAKADDKELLDILLEFFFVDFPKLIGRYDVKEEESVVGSLGIRA